MTKRVIGTIGFGMLAAAMIALGGGCSTDDDDTTGTAGGGGVSATGGSSNAGQNAGGVAGGGGAASQFEADIRTICTTTSPLNCAGEPTVADCVANREADANIAIAAGCTAELQAALDCLRPHPVADFECSTATIQTAISKAGVCDTEQAAVVTCVMA